MKSKEELEDVLDALRNAFEVEFNDSHPYDELDAYIAKHVAEKKDSIIASRLRHLFPLELAKLQEIITARRAKPVKEEKVDPKAKEGNKVKRTVRSKARPSKNKG